MEIRSGKLSIKEAARKYGMSPTGINYWKINFGMRKPQGKHEKKRFSNLVSPQDTSYQKIRELETQVEKLKITVADLYVENELLKKLDSFTQTSKKQDISIVTAESLPQLLKSRKL